MKAAPFQGRIRDLADLKVFLAAHFPPACIGPQETPEEAHRRAGEVGLAQRIIATIDAADGPNALSDFDNL